MEPKSPQTERKSLLNFYSNKNDIFKIVRSKSSTDIKNFLRRKDQLKSHLKTLIDSMDSYTNARTTLFFVIIFYLLGCDLNFFIYIILLIYLYLLSYRLIRFWVKNSLMYMLDFVYFGNICLIIFLLFFKKNENFFLIIFSISTGVIGLTNITQKNKIELGDSDFAMNTFLDCIPALATSAIRWKNKIYYKNFDNFLHIDNNLEIKENFNLIWKIIWMPIVTWILWGGGYWILNGKILRGFAFSHLFESSIYNFYHSNYLEKILGDHKKFTIMKYLLTQFTLLVVSIPVVIGCFFNPYINLVYIILMNLLLGINTAKAKNDELKKLVKKVE